MQLLFNDLLRLGFSKEQSLSALEFCPLLPFPPKMLSIYLDKKTLLNPLRQRNIVKFIEVGKRLSRTDKVKIHRYQVDRRLLWSNAFCIASLLRKRLHGTISPLFYSHFHSFFRLFSSFCTFFTFSSRKFLPP